MNEPTLTAKQYIAFELTKQLIKQDKPDAADTAISYAEKILKSDQTSIGFVRDTRSK